MFLPPDPDFYRDVPKVLANLPETTLTREERQRLEARMAQNRTSRLYCQALCWVGGRLVRWGMNLLERYGTATTSTLQQIPKV